MWLVFEIVAVTLWLTKDNLFYLLNFSYIGSAIALGLLLFQLNYRHARRIGFIRYITFTASLVFVGALFLCHVENIEQIMFWAFLVGNIHHLDMGTLLDRLGIAVRTGHHCAEPLMRRLGIEGTVRASFGLYNTKTEVDALVAGIARVSRMF